MTGVGGEPRTYIEFVRDVRKRLVSLERRQKPTGLEVATSLTYGIPTIWLGSTAPDGTAFANGAAISREDNPILFGIFGTTYGAGDGESTFNLPNMQNRVPVGAGGSYALGATGGSSTVTLTTAQIPSHIHRPVYSNGRGPINQLDFSTATTGRTASAESVSVGGLSQINAGLRYTGGVANDGSGSDVGLVRMMFDEPTGGGGSHSNMQPYIAVNFIIRLG